MKKSVLLVILFLLFLVGITKASNLKVLVFGDNVYTEKALEWMDMRTGKTKTEDIEVYVNKEFGVFCFILKKSNSMSCIPAVFSKPYEETSK